MKMKYTILRKPFAWQYLMPNMIEDFNIEIEQANKLNTVCNMSAFNSTGLQELKKIADKYHQISNDFKIVEKDGKTEQYRDNENKTSDEEKNDKDTQQKNSLFESIEIEYIKQKDR